MEQTRTQSKRRDARDFRIAGKFGLGLAVIVWSMGCAEPTAPPPQSMLDHIQAQVAARNPFAWVGAGHNQALDFIYKDMKSGGIYHSPENFCGALKRAVKRYYVKYHPAQTGAAIAAEDKFLNSCGSPPPPGSAAPNALSTSRSISSPNAVAYNLVDTVANYYDLSPNAQKLLSKIDYYVSLNGTTQDLSDALANIDASAQTMVSGAEQEIVLSTSSGTVSSSAYWEANLYSWAQLYFDTTSAPVQYAIVSASTRQSLNSGFGTLTPPTGPRLGWGSCWGYVIQAACNAAKAIIGADLFGILHGATSTWYTSVFFGPAVGAGVIGAAGLAEGAAA